MTPEDIASWWAASPSSARAERISGGSINEVFRVRDGDDRVVVKYAPPYVASAPTIALSPRRLLIEARCLRELAPDGALDHVCDHGVRTPRLRSIDETARILAMEDLGPLADLDTVMRVAGNFDPDLGFGLGAFIGRLHAISSTNPSLLADLDNRDVQETRMRTQYAQVGVWAASLGIGDHAMLADHAIALGDRFLARGPCVIMGDLWPRSVLVDTPGLWVIDWEFAHAGNPAQDLGHLAAHLWMHASLAHSSARGVEIEALFERFCAGYREALDANGKAGLVTAQTLREATSHAGCEILARIGGPFRAGYLYEQLTPDDAAVVRAIDVARAALADGAPPLPWRW